MRIVRGISEQVFHGREEKQKEHACPKCDQLMDRFNYAATTGILLDKCSEHGIWFDKDELEQVQICVEEWEKTASADIAKYGPILEKIRHESQERLNNAVPDKLMARRSPILRFLLEWFE